jgi:putative SOS response-associated peptidase YedK
MCGRFRLSSDVSGIGLIFGIPPDRPTPNFPPSWNVAPTDSLPVVRYDAKAAQRSLDMLRWGLIPYCQGHQGRLRQHQGQGRRDREEAGFRQGVRAPALFGAGRQFLRVAQDRNR